MRDYTISIRFGAEDDMDAWRFGALVREAVGTIDPDKKIGRYLVSVGPTEMMFTRYHVIHSSLSPFVLDEEKQ